MKLFCDDCNNMSNLDFTDYSAGGITEDGVIAYYQMGAEESFSVGMPIYSMDNKFIGRLSRGFYDWLSCDIKDLFNTPVPAIKWFIEGYKGDRQPIKTYWQRVKEEKK